jgi:hypothetical protein
MPAYICDSIFKSAVDAGVDVETYDLDDQLFPKNLPRELPEQHAVIYVNYFGLCQQHITRLLEEIPKNSLIVDNSHALFAEHTDALATVYSPRKFVGLPDGGLLRASSELKITPPRNEDKGSLARMNYLLTRMAYSARAGYEGFDRARKSLMDTTPLAMSKLTQRLMKSIQWDQVIERRRINYTTMSRMMDPFNDIQWPLEEKDVPLCYPLSLRGTDTIKIKKQLSEKNVFTATYWPDALPRIRTNSIEWTLVNETLYLPIDQRLDRTQVEKVGRLVLRLTDKNLA